MSTRRTTNRQEPDTAGAAPGDAAARVLVAHSDVAVLRLIREALENYTVAEIVTTPSAEYAFEHAMRRSFSLFVFQMSLPILPGELLYSLIAKAHAHCHGGQRIAPPVIYTANEQDRMRIEELRRDARVRGVLSSPLSIDRLLEYAGNLLPKRESTD